MARGSRPPPSLTTSEIYRQLSSPNLLCRWQIGYSNSDISNTNWGRFLYVWLDCWMFLFQIGARGRYVFHCCCKWWTTVSLTQALLLKKAHYNWTVCSEWWWLELRGADSISRWWHLEKMSWFEASSVMINQAHQSHGGIKSWLLFFSWLLTAVALVVVMNDGIMETGVWRSFVHRTLLMIPYINDDRIVVKGSIDGAYTPLAPP